MEALLPLIISLLASILFTTSIIDLGQKKKLFETNSLLKCHKEQVCSLGGISIFAAFWIAIFLTGIVKEIASVELLFVGSFILFLTGVKDDLVGIPPLRRLFIQVAVAGMLFIGGVQLNYLPGISAELPMAVSFLVSIFIMGAIVNALNFIDGINGLAGGLSVISLVSFSLLFYFSGEFALAGMALALTGAVIGFLWFNFGTAKIFMGDNGSTFLGIILSFFFITSLNKSLMPGNFAPFAPAVLLAILIVPLGDLVKVTLTRVADGKSPFKGDRTHIHHILTKMGLSAENTCWLLYGWSAVVILFSMYLLPQNIFIALPILIAIGSLPYVFISLRAKLGKNKNTLVKPRGLSRSSSAYSGQLGSPQ